MAAEPPPGPPPPGGAAGGPLLEVQDVEVAYGAGVLALRGVSLHVRPV